MHVCNVWCMAVSIFGLLMPFFHLGGGDYSPESAEKDTLPDRWGASLLWFISPDLCACMSLCVSDTMFWSPLGVEEPPAVFPCTPPAQWAGLQHLRAAAVHSCLQASECNRNQGRKWLRLMSQHRLSSVEQIHSLQDAVSKRDWILFYKNILNCQNNILTVSQICLFKNGISSLVVSVKKLCSGFTNSLIILSLS